MTKARRHLQNINLKPKEWKYPLIVIPDTLEAESFPLWLEIIM